MIRRYLLGVGLCVFDKIFYQMFKNSLLFCLYKKKLLIIFFIFKLHFFKISFDFELKSIKNNIK